MKRILNFFLSFCMVLGLCACGQKAEISAPADTPTWQEQYDLGIRYLSEGNYEEAIIAFTAAIEIDPKRADTYLGLADVYAAMGNTEQANAVLQEALEKVDDPASIEEKLAALNPERPTLDGYPKTDRHDMDDGGYVLTEYDPYGNCIAQTYYGSDDAPYYRLTWTYDADGTLISKTESSYAPEDVMTERYLEYDAQRRVTYVLETWKDGPQAFNYAYNGKDVTVTMKFESAQYGTIEDVFSYTLSADAHYMTIAGMGYSTDGIDVNHVMEYDEREGIVGDVYLTE